MKFLLFSTYKIRQVWYLRMILAFFLPSWTLHNRGQITRKSLTKAQFLHSISFYGGKRYVPLALLKITYKIWISDCASNSEYNFGQLSKIVFNSCQNSEINLQEMDKILENRVIEKLFSSSNILGTYSRIKQNQLFFEFDKWMINSFLSNIRDMNIT